MTFSNFLKLLSIKRTCHLWLNVTVNPARGLPSLQFTSSCEGWNYEMFSVTSCVERRRCRCSFSCFKEEMKWKLSLLHLQDLLKVIKNVFYSFSISHFVLELFKFVWNVNETTSDVKLCTDHLKLLENHAHL